MIFYTEREVELMIAPYQKALTKAENELSWLKTVMHQALRKLPGQRFFANIEKMEAIRPFAVAALHTDYDKATGSLVYLSEPLIPQTEEK